VRVKRLPKTFAKGRPTAVQVRDWVQTEALAGGAVVDIAPVAPGSVTATTISVALSATATWRGKFTITDAAIGPTSKVLCWQAPGPYTGKGTLADEAEMQPVQVIAVTPAAGSAVVMWQTPPGFAMRPVLASGSNRSPAGATFDRVVNQLGPIQYVPTRIGKVRGSVKFSYTVLA
jgi:hypothetical protein